MLQPAAADSVPEKVWGGLGGGKGQFSKPRAIAIDSQDHLYIVDMTARIQVFDVDGNYIRGWQTPEQTSGRPTGLTISSIDGNLMVADTHYFRILTYTPTGDLLTHATLGGTMGQGPGEFGLVSDVIRDRDANYYISEYGEWDRIQKLSPNGKFIMQWGGHGSDPGQFLRPQHIEFDADGLLWVADACNHRIQVFDRQGKLIKMWGDARQRAGPIVLPVLPGPRWQRTSLRLRVRQSPRAEVYARWQVDRLLGQRGPQAGPTEQPVGVRDRQPRTYPRARFDEPPRAAVRAVRDASETPTSSWEKAGVRVPWNHCLLEFVRGKQSRLT